MKLKKRENIENKIIEIEDDNDLPVYEGEIIDEEDEAVKLKPIEAAPLAENFFSKLSRAAGVVVAAVGFVNEIRDIFKDRRSSDVMGLSGDQKRRAGQGLGQGVCKEDKQKFFGGPGGDFSKKPPGRRRQEKVI